MDAAWNLDENNPGAVGPGAQPEADAEQTAAAAEDDDQGPSPVPADFWVPLRECPHYTPADPKFDQLDLFAKAPPDLLLCVLAQLRSAQHLCFSQTVSFRWYSLLHENTSAWVWQRMRSLRMVANNPDDCVRLVRKCSFLTALELPDGPVQLELLPLMCSAMPQLQQLTAHSISVPEGWKALGGTMPPSLNEAVEIDPAAAEAEEYPAAAEEGDQSVQDNRNCVNLVKVKVSEGMVGVDEVISLMTGRPALETLDLPHLTQGYIPDRALAQSHLKRLNLLAAEPGSLSGLLPHCQQLQHIHLGRGAYVDDAVMGLLGSQPSLESLTFDTCALGVNASIGSLDFPCSIKKLILHSIGGLFELQIVPLALESLEITGCDELLVVRLLPSFRDRDWHSAHCEATFTDNPLLRELYGSRNPQTLVIEMTLSRLEITNCQLLPLAPLLAESTEFLTALTYGGHREHALTLPAMPMLQELVLEDSTTLQELELQPCDTLQELSLAGLHQLNKITLIANQFPALQKLSLCTCPRLDNQVYDALLTGGAALSVLNIDNCKWLNSIVVPQTTTTASIVSCTELRELISESPLLQQIDLDWLTKLKFLKLIAAALTHATINLRGASLTDLWLDAPAMQTLYLANVSSCDALHVVHTDCVQKLTVESCAFDSAQVVQLLNSSLSTLRVLDVSACQHVSELHLEGAVWLSSLSVRGCKRVKTVIVNAEQSCGQPPTVLFQLCGHLSQVSVTAAPGCWVGLSCSMQIEHCPKIRKIQVSQCYKVSGRLNKACTVDVVY